MAESASRGRIRRAGPRAIEALECTSGGRIASVHARAINIRLDEGPVLALLPTATSLHPWALESDVSGADFGSLGSAIDGARVVPAGDAFFAGPCRFEFGTAAIADLRLSQRFDSVPTDGHAHLVRALAIGLEPGRFDALLAEELTEFAQGGSAEKVAAHLVGLGEGFTPAGDDALVGILAGLDAASVALPAASLLRAAVVAALPQPLEARTTRLAAQMLAAAAEGLYAEPVLGFLAAFPDPQKVQGPGLMRLLRMGHRSGWDTFHGLAAALSRVARIASRVGLPAT